MKRLYLCHQTCALLFTDGGNRHVVGKLINDLIAFTHHQDFKAGQRQLRNHLFIFAAIDRRLQEKIIKNETFTIGKRQANLFRLGWRGRGVWVAHDPRCTVVVKLMASWKQTSDHRQKIIQT